MCNQQAKRNFVDNYLFLKFCRGKSHGVMLSNFTIFAKPMYVWCRPGGNGVISAVAIPRAVAPHIGDRETVLPTRFRTYGKRKPAAIRKGSANNLQSEFGFYLPSSEAVWKGRTTIRQVLKMHESVMDPDDREVADCHEELAETLKAEVKVAEGEVPEWWSKGSSR
jgi:hypothetical protein